MKNSKKMDNKGFSLVELIIVIAIMAILVGIVGTQVIPYLNRSREAKDNQILDAFSTAAVTAYSYNAEAAVFSSAQAAAATATASSAATQVTVNLGTTYADTDDESVWVDAIWELTSYTSVTSTDPTDTTAVANAMSSSAGRTITDIEITIDFYTNELTVTASDGTNDVLDVVTSHI